MQGSVVRRTQELLGRVIRKPPLTERLLSKPPFRYLHDVIGEVIRSTGFMKGLYTEAEMKSDNVKDKDAKIIFLQKAIDVVIMDMNLKEQMNFSKQLLNAVSISLNRAADMGYTPGHVCSVIPSRRLLSSSPHGGSGRVLGPLVISPLLSIRFPIPRERVHTPKGYIFASEAETGAGVEAEVAVGIEAAEGSLRPLPHMQDELPVMATLTWASQIAYRERLHAAGG
ncbi:TRAF3-interacting protein 1 [Crotalus adamanteus]|uniref:TRAF3-interacting protein 1 n=1 Tax=Crotalus adamanteus TaxID=8729 RepID=A0AAW1CB09_CROAD